MKVEILQDQKTVAERAATLMCELAGHGREAAALNDRAPEIPLDSNPFNVALSGGTTPKMLYKCLTNDRWKECLPWQVIRWFVGDERNVPLDHTDNNFHLAKTELFDPAGVPEAYQFPLTRVGVAPPEQVACDYELDILEYVKPRTAGGVPQFDLILLGIGTDGHTASLFPHTKALTPPAGKVVVANYVEKRQTWRITLTPDVIRAAKHVVVLVAGEDKAEALSHVLEGEDDFFNYPAQIARDLPGAIWLVDEPAGSMLKKK